MWTRSLSIYAGRLFEEILRRQQQRLWRTNMITRTVMIRPRLRPIRGVIEGDVTENGEKRVDVRYYDMTAV